MPEVPTTSPGVRVQIARTSTTLLRRFMRWLGFYPGDTTAAEMWQVPRPKPPRSEADAFVDEVLASSRRPKRTQMYQDHYGPWGSVSHEGTPPSACGPRKRKSLNELLGGRGDG